MTIHSPDCVLVPAGSRTRSMLFKSSAEPPTTETPLAKLLPRYVVPSGAMRRRSRSFINLDSDCGAFALPSTSLHANVRSIPFEASMSNEYSNENPACNSRASSWKMSSTAPLYCGVRLFSRSICPQPSLLLGMSGVPKSSAPLTSVALMMLAEGLLIPAISRRYSRAKAAEPPATAVA